ncbi:MULTISPECIES: DoxX family protein [Maribacter]|mgnify:FL=1|uniref:DoxX family protein n=1 Tax=Maribacter TaxID=252356 RepID=UPI000E313735|nr:DoxX family membrane protein [Maribacter litoralis]|tara:strand:+ start:8205 stop:8591 length:387 start_codon:yes stop_codon:yes gene_type:complete
MKRLFWNIVKIILALFMIYGGVQHFVKPNFYMPFVPSFLPYPIAVIYVSGIIEIVLGFTLLVNKKYAKLAALGVLVLMILFLPIHIWDVFSETPAIGGHDAALIRLPIQFVLIALSWKVYSMLSIKKV